MTLMTLMTAMTMNCRGSLNRVRHSPEMGDGGSMRSTSAAKSDAGVKRGVPTSSRTSYAARVELPIPLYLEGRYSSTHLILEAIPRTSESAHVVPDETFTKVAAVPSDTSLGGAIGP
jgi:hypothetical protein